jgi:hypothetical protein
MSTAMSSHVKEVQVCVHRLYARQPGVSDVQVQAAQYAAPPAVRARCRKFRRRNSQVVAAHDHDWNMFSKGEVILKFFLMNRVEGLKIFLQRILPNFENSR